MDAARWTEVVPVDRIADSPSEQYKIPMDRLSAGEHTLQVKLTTLPAMTVRLLMAARTGGVLETGALVVVIRTP